MSFATRAIGPLRVSTLGLGGTGLGGLYRATDPATAAAVVALAIEAGVTLVDTAPYYGFGLSERVVGDALRRRTGIALSTKVGRLLVPGRGPEAARAAWPGGLPFHPAFDYTRAGILRSFEDSLQRLGLDRIDLLLVHDIGRYTHGGDARRHWDDLAGGGYAALDGLRAEGRVGAIGLGVNEVEACLDALGLGRWDAFLLAGRYTLLEQGALDVLLPACARAGTAILCGGPFNSGILVGGNTWDYATAPASVRERVERLRAIAREVGVPLPALALQFPLGHPTVASVIPGLADLPEIEATLAWARLPIPAEAWAALRDAGLLHPDAPLPVGNPFVSA